MELMDQLGTPLLPCELREARPHDPPRPGGARRDPHPPPSDASMEATNTTIRLITRRAYGFPQRLYPPLPSRL